MAKPGKANQMSDDRIAEIRAEVATWDANWTNGLDGMVRDLLAYVDAAVKEREEWKREADRRAWPKDAAQEFHRNKDRAEAAEADAETLRTDLTAEIQKSLAAEADAERLAEALEQIADDEWTRTLAAYDPPFPIQIARAALAVHATRNEGGE